MKKYIKVRDGEREYFSVGGFASNISFLKSII